MKCSTTLLILLLFCYDPLSAQEKKEAKPPFNPSILVGLNNTKFVLDREQLDPLLSPYLGMVFELKQSNKISLLISTSYYKKASRYITGVNLERQGFELSLYPGIKIDDFTFYSGLQLNTTVSESFKTKRHFTIPEELPQIEHATNVIPVIGVNIKLMNNLSLMINQSLFFFSTKFDSNTQFAIRYHFGPEIKARTPSYRELVSNRSKEQIQELKEGVLLIRLNQSHLKIDALKRFGHVDKAEKFEQRQLELNKEIMRVFKEQYTFSKVQFFYSNQTIDVKNRNYKSIFLNEHLEVDSTIVIDSSKYVYTAELANIKQDTAKFLSNYRPNVEGNFVEKRSPTYYGGSDISFQAFIIKDYKLNQLCRPFPYYSRYVGESIRKHPEQLLFISAFIFPLIKYSSIEKSVERLDRKLFKFYQNTLVND